MFKSVLSSKRSLISPNSLFHKAQMIIIIFSWKVLLLWTQVDIHKMIYKCLMMIIEGSKLFTLGPELTNAYKCLTIIIWIGVLTCYSDDFLSKTLRSMTIYPKNEHKIIIWHFVNTNLRWSLKIAYKCLVMIIWTGVYTCYSDNFLS